MNKIFIFSKIGANNQLDLNILCTIQEALGKNRTLEWIQRRTDSNYRDTYFAAYEIDGEIACVNFFTPFSFIRNSERLKGYQSGFSATKISYKGKGLWVGLMKEAENYLLKRNCSFIFGFPNSVSLPIFVNKLRYQIKAMEPALIFRNSILQSMLAHKNIINHNTQNQLKGDMNDFLDWQRRQSKDEIIEYTYDNCLVWGKMKKLNAYKFDINVFEIGGINGYRNTDIYKIIQKIMAREDINISTMYLSKMSLRSLPGYYLRRKNIPVIFKGLTADVDLLDDIYFTGGMRDTF